MDTDHRPFRVDPRLLELAREMRHDSAPAEEKLWFFLRNRKLGGFKFRRQVPVDRYVADFLCVECMLIVETDGDSHFDAKGESERNDAARTRDLNARGYEVVRFTNPDVFDNMEGVLESILEACERRGAALRSAPHPNPLP